MSSFNLIRAILVSTFLVFTASTAQATEVECKRYDTKCVKAQKKAQFTQAYFRILDAGIRAEWDAKKLRELFTKEEQRELKKIGLDVSNRRLVQALEKKYQETFSHLDPNAWQSVLDTILHQDYVAKQIKYKLMNVAVVDRLKKELERSGKKTIKAKSGNFSTRSGARSAVVVLEDMRRAQSALMKELSKAGDDLDIDVLAEALEKTTIILVDRNEKVAKALRNPKELEKILIKASKSSGVEPVKILKKMNVAAAPAIQVIKKTVDAKIEKSEQAAQIRTKQVKDLNDSSIIDLVVTISAMGDGDVPALPDDLSTLTIQELRDIYPDAKDEDYTKMMRDYARHAKLQETAKISADVRWEQNQPGMLYRYTLEEVWDAGYKGQMSKALMNKMDGETAELWAMVKEVEARTKNGQLALNQEIVLEQQNIAKTGEEGDDESEEGRLEQLHWDEATQIENTLIKMYSNVHAAVLFDNNQLAYIESVLDDAFKFLNVAKGAGNTDLLQQELFKLADQSQARLDNDLLMAEQLAVNDTAALAANDAYVALANLSVVNQMIKDFPDPEGDGLDPSEVSAALGEHNLQVIYDGIDSFSVMLERGGMNKDLALQAFVVFEEVFKVLLGSESSGQDWQDQLVAIRNTINDSSASGSYHDIKEMQFAMEDAATAANMDELASEIAKIQDAITNIQDEYDKAISMGASPDEAAAYMADQHAQMQAGMAELCAAGDSNACQ